MPWPKGKPRSDEEKRKISAAQQGLYRGWTSHDTKDCRICGTEFTPNSARHWFCSPDCKALDHYEKKTGITHAEYLHLLGEQNGVCATCLRPAPNGNRYHVRFFLDHSHATGRRRGLLCFNCNRGIGLFGDDPQVLRRAAAYLERYAAD